MHLLRLFSLDGSAVISVVIPSYRGGQRLCDLCKQLYQVLSDLPEHSRNFEIIVVLDGPDWESSEALQELLDQRTIEQLIRLPENRGQQEATICGLQAARGKWIITMDDDFQHPPAVVPQILKTLKEGADLLFMVPAFAGRARTRSLGSRIRTGLFYLASGRRKGIIPSSFRAFHRSLLDPLLEKMAQGQHLYYLSLELLLHARKPCSLPLPPGQEADSLEKSRHSLCRLFFQSMRLALYLLPGCFLRLSRRREALPTFLVVGGGKGQLGLIRRICREGYRLVVSDRDPGAPGAVYAESLLLADTFDPEETLEKSRVHRQRGGSIDAVLTAGTDQPVRSMTATARGLALFHSLSIDTAEAVTNKRVMKGRLRALGLPTLDFQILENRGDIPEDPAFYPGVVKPVDSQGQRGVLYVESPGDLERSLAESLSWSRSGQAVLEPFCPGDELTFSAWIDRGELFPQLLSDRRVFRSGKHIGICPAHRYPSFRHSGKSDEIIALAREFIRGFGICSGPLYIQFFATPSGIYFNEAACRIGGAYEEVLVPALGKGDLLDLQMELSLRGRLRPGQESLLRSQPGLPSSYASVVLAFASAGRVVSTGSREALISIDNIVDGDYLLAPGDVLGATENSTGRAAWAVVKAESRDAVNRSVHELFNTLELRSESGQNLIVDQRSYALHQEEE